MFSILYPHPFQRSFLMRLLQTTGLSLALMTASAAGVHAEDVTVQGSPGANGASGVIRAISASRAATESSQTPMQAARLQI